MDGTQPAELSRNGSGRQPPPRRLRRTTAPTEPAPSRANRASDITLRIAPVLADIAKDHTISTIGYNGQVPGPLIRLREGVPVTVDLFNDTDVPEFVHWHGLIVPADVDGAPEEKSLRVARARASALPPHAAALRRAVRPFARDVDVRSEPGNLLRAIRIRLHRTKEQSRPVRSGDLPRHPRMGTVLHRGRGGRRPGRHPGRESAQGREDKNSPPNGWEIGYQRFTINGKALGYGEPVRVKEGQRVLFHILNGSATENIQLALCRAIGFKWSRSMAIPCRIPQLVDVLELGTAERISAMVEMKNPGVWILGTPHDDDRRDGMGIVVEYANRSRRASLGEAATGNRGTTRSFGDDQRRSRTR